MDGVKIFGYRTGMSSGYVLLRRLMLVCAHKRILTAPAARLENSSARNDIARPRCCSTLRLSASRTRASTRSSSTRSTAPISTCERVSLATSSSAEVARWSKASGASSLLLMHRADKVRTQ